MRGRKRQQWRLFRHQQRRFAVPSRQSKFIKFAVVKQREPDFYVDGSVRFPEKMPVQFP
jgi:hypothetical protein